VPNHFPEFIANSSTIHLAIRNVEWRIFFSQGGRIEVADSRIVVVLKIRFAEPPVVIAVRRVGIRVEFESVAAVHLDALGAAVSEQRLLIGLPDRGFAQSLDSGLFEFAIGLKPDALSNTLTWDLNSTGVSGCERFRFNGHVVTAEFSMPKAHHKGAPHSCGAC
jgi:hypothetical protein